LVNPDYLDILSMFSEEKKAFVEAWQERMDIEIEGISVPVLNRRHLIENKRATGRPQDLADVAWLEADGSA
jgi:hypothetical protein